MLAHVLVVTTHFLLAWYGCEGMIASAEADMMWFRSVMLFVSMSDSQTLKLKCCCRLMKKLRYSSGKLQPANLCCSILWGFAICSNCEIAPLRRVVLRWPLLIVPVAGMEVRCWCTVVIKAVTDVLLELNPTKVLTPRTSTKCCILCST